MNEPRCQSINYVMEENICELNNRSKEARPEDYVTDPGKIYMTVPFNKGMCISTSAAVAAETVPVNELVFIKESRGTKPSTSHEKKYVTLVLTRVCFMFMLFYSQYLLGPPPRYQLRRVWK